MPIEQPPEKRFIFNGSAVAFAARLRRPGDAFVKAAAPAHLPVTGGFSEAHVEGLGIEQYHHGDFITFKRAYSRAHGDFSDPRAAVDFTHGNHGQNHLPTNTAVESRVEELRIDAPAHPESNTPRRIFQVKNLKLHTESTSDRRGETSFRSLSAAFDGVTLTTVTNNTSGTVELKVHTATEVFSENDTKAKLIETYAKDGEFRRKYAACFHPIGANLPGILGNLLGKHEIPKAEKGPIIATFVTGLEWVGGAAPEGTELLNNRLTVHGLGRVYFGEIVVEDDYRRSTLLRFEFGSQNGGDGCAVECVNNGTSTSA